MGLVIAVPALAILALALAYAIQSSATPLAPATPPAGTAAAPTFPATGYPGPTMEATTTATLEPDVSLTLAWLQTSQPIATVHYPVGIYQEGLAEYSRLGFNIKNGWRRDINGYPARVAAGALTSDPQQGIILASWDLPGAANAGVYETPNKVGAVQIVAEENYRLTLQAEDGTIFYFDVPAQRFVTSLTEVAPTVTPRPSSTPVPPTDSFPKAYPGTTNEPSPIPPTQTAVTP